MRYAILIALSVAINAHAADVVLGVPSTLTWRQGVGANLIAEWQSATPWYAGIGLTAAWPCDDGTGTNVADRVGVYNGWFSGTYPTWASAGGLSAIRFHGTNTAVSSSVSMGDVLDLGTNSVAMGAWVFLAGAQPNDGNGIVGKTYYGAQAARYALYFDAASKPVAGVQIDANANSIGVPTCSSAAPTGMWVNVSMLLIRSSGSVQIWTNGAYCSGVTVVDSGADANSVQPFQLGRYAANASGKTFNGFVRDAWVRIGGSSTEASNTLNSVWSRTKTVYGR